MPALLPWSHVGPGWEVQFLVVVRIHPRMETLIFIYFEIMPFFFSLFFLTLLLRANVRQSPVQCYVNYGFTV